METEYASGLKAYLVRPGEEALEHAYNLGRSGINMGLGVLEMAAIHRRALEANIRRARNPDQCVKVAAAASTFFAECLGPFEIVHQGYRDTSAQLGRVNQALSERAAQLTSANEQLGELSRSRTAFLADAGQRLIGSLEVEATLQAVVDLAVPGLAGWCAVDLLEDGRVHRAAAAPSDPQEGPKLEEQRQPILLADDVPIARVLRTGKPELDLVPSLEAFAGRRRKHLRQVGTGSCMVVPLAAHGRPLGTITLVAPEGRSYDSHDLLLAEDFGRRAAMALEQARLYQEAQQAIRARDDFLSIASHELRTPLTPLMLRLQAAARRLEKGEALELRSLHAVIRQVDRLGILVNDLLDVSRIQAGKIELRQEPLDLAPLVAEVAASFRAAAPEHPLLLELQAPARLLGDRARLEQVVTNLVDNAVKYSPPGGRIDIKLAPSGAELLLSVADQGIGIPERQQLRLFERFFRASNAQQGTMGLGLGLYICRDLVNRHGGRIWVESKEGEGSNFFVALPALEAQADTQSS